jgi:hypothetical protein
MGRVRSALGLAVEWVHGESRLPNSPLAIAPIRALVLECARAAPVAGTAAADTGTGTGAVTGTSDAAVVGAQQPAAGGSARAFPAATVETVDISNGGLHFEFYARWYSNSYVSAVALDCVSACCSAVSSPDSCVFALCRAVMCRDVM